MNATTDLQRSYDTTYKEHKRYFLSSRSCKNTLLVKGTSFINLLSRILG